MAREPVQGDGGAGGRTYAVHSITNALFSRSDLVEARGALIVLYGIANELVIDRQAAS
jgi:hypothetical protein